MHMQQKFRIGLLAVAAWAAAVPVHAATVVYNEDMGTLRGLRRDPGIDVTGERVQLTRSLMIQDEVGNTDYRNVQPLSATTWGKKTLVLPYAADAELIFYGSAPKIMVNGHTAPRAEVISSTAWSHVNLPGAWLRAGENEVIFSGPGELLLENSVHPDRSARSIDGGKTWMKDELGPDGVHNGEFCVRIRLKAFNRQGILTSDSIDLLDPEGKQMLHPQAKISTVKLTPMEAQMPRGTSLMLEARAGSTPRYDTAAWTSWAPVGKSGETAVPAGARYLQWRARLTTNTAAGTPSFKDVRLTVDEDEQLLPDNVKLTELQSYPVIERSYPFAYQHESSRLKILRDKYHLADVVAPGKTELEQIVLLRNWVRNQWPKGWEHNDLQFVPPWDALVILDMAKREQALGMCTHYSTVFVQCALALGFNARQLVLDHHCAAEIWSDQFGKWMVVDTGNSYDATKNCHFEKDGVPLDALEIRDLWLKKQLNQITVVYSPPYQPINGQEMTDKKVDQIQFNTYIRFCAAFRNNHLDTPFPGELEQGEANYFYDGYLWWQDGAVPTHYTEYKNLTYRPQDLYWNLNQVQLDLQAGTPNTVRASFATQTPNFSHYLVRLDGGEWKKQVDSSFNWPLHAGTNKLEVKVVNTFGREGRPSSATLEVGA